MAYTIPPITESIKPKPASLRWNSSVKRLESLKKFIFILIFVIINKNEDKNTSKLHRTAEVYLLMT